MSALLDRLEAVLQAGSPLLWLVVIVFVVAWFFFCAWANRRLIAWRCARGEHDHEFGEGPCYDCGAWPEKPSAIKPADPAGTAPAVGLFSPAIPSAAAPVGLAPSAARRDSAAPLQHPEIP